MNYAAILAIVVLMLLLSCSKSLSSKKLSYQFDVDTMELSINLPLVSGLLEQHRNADRSITHQPDAAIDDLSREYYDLFLGDEGSDHILSRLVSELSVVAEANNLDLIEVVVSFVQKGIMYDHAKARRMEFVQNYAIETLYLREGVCSDKAILLGKLLTLLDYEYVFFTFPDDKHLAVGIRVPSGFGSFGSDYCYIEVTSPHQMGVLPKELIGKETTIIRPENNGQNVFNDIVLYKTRELEQVALYGKNYLLANALNKRRIQKLRQLERDIIHQKELLESNDYIDEEYNRQVEIINKQIGEHSRLALIIE